MRKNLASERLGGLCPIEQAGSVVEAMMQDRVCQTPDCGKYFKGGPRAYYCPNCRIERKKIAKKQYLQRKAAGQSRSIGDTDQCERCGGDYTVESGTQRFCPDCQPIHAAEHDRKTGLEFYHQHAERINPPRYERRKIGSGICPICGEPVGLPEGRKICAKEECQTEYRRRYQREYAAKKREENKTIADGL